MWWFASRSLSPLDHISSWAQSRRKLKVIMNIRQVNVVLFLFFFLTHFWRKSNKNRSTFTETESDSTVFSSRFLSPRTFLHWTATISWPLFTYSNSLWFDRKSIWSADRTENLWAISFPELENDGSRTAATDSFYLDLRFLSFSLKISSRLYTRKISNRSSHCSAPPEYVRLQLHCGRETLFSTKKKKNENYSLWFCRVRTDYGKRSHRTRSNSGLNLKFHNRRALRLTVSLFNQRDNSARSGERKKSVPFNRLIHLNDQHDYSVVWFNSLMKTRVSWTCVIYAVSRDNSALTEPCLPQSKRERKKRARLFSVQQ